MKSLRILGLQVKLEVLDSTTDDFGQWDWGKCTLSLAEGLESSWKAETLWHEILHAISDRLALDLSEKQVQRIAAAQFAVLKENPELLEFLGE